MNTQHQQDDEDDDDGDLIASVPEASSRGDGGPPRGSAFGSVSLGMRPPQAKALVATVQRVGGALGAQMQRRRALARPMRRRA